MTTPVTTILLVASVCTALLGWDWGTCAFLVLAAANQAAFAWATSPDAIDREVS